MAYQFPKNPVDGQEAQIKQPNGTEFIYIYNQAQNTWELAGQGIDLDQNNIVIYTDNVLTRTGPRPDPIDPGGYIETRTDAAYSEAIKTQRDANWVLHDALNALSLIHI